MRNVDPERVRFLLGRMDENIGDIKRLSIGDEVAFLNEENRMIRDVTEHYLQKAIEAALDVGRHTCAELSRSIILARGWQAPEEPQDVPRILRGDGVIDEPLSQKLTELARLRNLLIHRYGDVDHHRLHAIITSELDTLDKYARAVLHHVQKGPDPRGLDRLSAGDETTSEVSQNLGGLNAHQRATTSTLESLD